IADIHKQLNGRIRPSSGVPSPFRAQPAAARNAQPQAQSSTRRQSGSRLTAAISYKLCLAISLFHWQQTTQPAEMRRQGFSADSRLHHPAALVEINERKRVIGFSADSRLHHPAVFVKVVAIIR